jgi:hypothetical protein
MSSLRLSHISPMHAGFTSPASVRACASGGKESLVLGSRNNELAQATSDYRPEISWKGNGMT